ncbi:MAG: glycosyltransferase family 4 protein [Deltaproteobacteria bacterium]|nr:MAG: glycosyltransferase family 4 protein [Deltaproteobacteria bacterium]
MDILIIETGGWGGIGHYAHFLCAAMQKKRVSVCLLTHAHNYQLENIPKTYEVVKLFKGDSFILDWKRLLKQVRSRSSQIVHFQSLLSTRRDWLTFLAVGTFCATPKFIYTAHNVIPHEFLVAERIAYRGLYACAAGIITHSHISRDRISAMMGKHFNKPVTVIPLGHYGEITRAADLSRSSALKLLALKDYSYLVFFGAIRPYKGLPNFLRAVAETKDWPEDVKLLIAGQPMDGVCGEELRRLGNDLGIDQRVEFRFKYFPEELIPAIFKIADLVVLPYLSIDQSGVLMAAMAAGRPTLCTPVGAFPETVHPGIGFLAADISTVALTQALKQALRHRHRWEVMGANARKDAEIKFSWDKIAEKTITFYKKILMLPG